MHAYFGARLLLLSLSWTLTQWWLELGLVGACIHLVLAPLPGTVFLIAVYLITQPLLLAHQGLLFFVVFSMHALHLVAFDLEGAVLSVVVASGRQLFVDALMVVPQILGVHSLVMSVPVTIVVFWHISSIVSLTA